MAFLGIIGSILLGISVIVGLIKQGEIGCFGIILIVILLIILISIFGVVALIAMGV